MNSKPRSKQAKSSFTCIQTITIDNVVDLQKKFLKLLDKNTNISFNCKDIDNIDLNGIQFLVFAKKIAKEKGIELEYNVNYYDNALDLIKKTGFEDILEIKQ